MSALTGTRALVTGGRRGIGFAFARRLAELGAHVRVTSRDAASALAALGPLAERCEALEWDMRDEASRARLESAIKLDPPTIVVHAAHDFPEHVPIVGLRDQAMTDALLGYVPASYALLRTASRAMMRAGGGRIAVLSSLAVELAPPGQAAYVASKLALEGIARVLASEVHARNVGVCIVRAGIVDTENVRARVPAEAQQLYAERNGLGRLLTADEIVDATLPYLAPNAPASNGTVLRIGAVAHAERPS